jgi:hypothetical protein
VKPGSSRDPDIFLFVIRCWRYFLSNGLNGWICAGVTLTLPYKNSVSGRNSCSVWWIERLSERPRKFLGEGVLTCSEVVERARGGTQVVAHLPSSGKLWVQSPAQKKKKKKNHVNSLCLSSSFPGNMHGSLCDTAKAAGSWSAIDCHSLQKMYPFLTKSAGKSSVPLHQLSKLVLSCCVVIWLTMLSSTSL